MSNINYTDSVNNFFSDIEDWVRNRDEEIITLKHTAYKLVNQETIRNKIQSIANIDTVDTQLQDELKKIDKKKNTSGTSIIIEEQLEKAIKKAAEQNDGTVDFQHLALFVFTHPVIFSFFDCDRSDIQSSLLENNSANSSLAEFGEPIESKPKLVGRKLYVDQIIRCFLQQNKQIIVITGKNEAGRSTIARYALKKYADKYNLDTPYQVNASRFISGTRHQGEYENRIRDIFKKAASTEKPILLDELSGLVNENRDSIFSTAQNLVNTSGLNIVFVLSNNQYRSIEEEGGYTKEMQHVNIDPLSPRDTFYALYQHQKEYEKYHDVKLTEEALQKIVDLAKQYYDNALPGAAIQLLDETCASVSGGIKLKQSKLKEQIEKMRYEAELDKNNDPELRKIIRSIINKASDLVNGERDAIESVKEKCSEALILLNDVNNNRLSKVISEIQSLLEEHRGSQQDRHVVVEDVAEIVSEQTNTPMHKLTRDDDEKMKNIEDVLNNRVIGQNDAVHCVSNAVRRSYTGLARPDTPIGTFLFLGPTGVGKTELAKTLADFMFNSKDSMVRLDMSEFTQEQSTSRLVGAPPGYVGYEQGGRLTEAVKEHPYAVVLLDEIEKAHSKVYDLLLQVFDDGRLTDSKGETVDFTNTIIIMTSNLGSNDIRDFYNDSSNHKPDDIEPVINNHLQQAFRPEFINRIDETVTFRPLEPSHLEKIVEVKVDNLINRAAKRDISLTLDEKVKKYLVENGYDPAYGARPMERLIRSTVVDNLTTAILKSNTAQFRAVLNDKGNIDIIQDD